MSDQGADQKVESGLWLRLTGDHEGARRLFEEALRLEPGHQRARELLNEPPQVAPAAAAPVKSPFENPRPPIAANVPSFEALLGGALPTVEATRPQTVPEAQSAWDSPSNPSVDLAVVAPPDDDALDLVVVDEQPGLEAPSSAQEPDELSSLLRGAQDLLELDDHSGALELLAKAEKLAPGDPRLRTMRERSERTLLAMLEAKLGALEARPKVVLKQDEIIWLNLDHRAGFVLAQIDGTLTYDELFAVSSMSRLDTARILVQLLDEGVIAA